MKTDLPMTRSRQTESRVGRPTMLHAIRTVPQPVERPSAPDLAGAAEFNQPAMEIPRAARQKRLAPVRPVVRIGYVLDRFPRASHGFVLQEILALESRGLDVHICSLGMPDG